MRKSKDVLKRALLLFHCSVHFHPGSLWLHVSTGAVCPSNQVRDSPSLCGHPLHCWLWRLRGISAGRLAALAPPRNDGDGDGSHHEQGRDDCHGRHERWVLVPRHLIILRTRTHPLTPRA